jgi:dTDP-glucose pyrophosphorylase
MEAGREHPRAVGEYLVERMTNAGASHICFVVAPEKSDIMEYFGGRVGETAICYAVQQKPRGLCDALFTALPFISPEDEVLVGLPDTIWLPVDGFSQLPVSTFSFLLFPVKRPELFDAVRCDASGAVLEIEVKQPQPRSHWVWGAFRLRGTTLFELYDLWRLRDPRDEYLGTLVNAFIARGGAVTGIKRGQVYVDLGTLQGYREAVRMLSDSSLFFADAA